MIKRIIFLLALFLGYLITGNVYSQVDLSKEKIPVDSKIKIGKLDNGFTYYIRENKKPENRLELRLVIKAGSMQEDENQLGLAHFVEHMCFNGTKHFEKNELIQYLQSIGVKFGADLNAYTSFTETVYMLTIPSDSTELVNKGFLVMEDWAHNVTFDDEEIDKERGIVIEEWRLGRGPFQRIRDKILPTIFGESRYSERLPIGKKEIIENADYETVRRFYRDWYRPDLMALIVVGDINSGAVEEKIKEHFSNLKMPDNPREHIEYDIPDHEGTELAKATDKELPTTIVELFYKNDPDPQETAFDYLHSLKYRFVTGLLNQRLAELREKPEPPFINAGFSYGTLVSKSKYVLDGYAMVSETGILSGMNALLEEAERVRRFGFTEGEFERFKLDVLKQYEKTYNERDKTESDVLAAELIRNYLEDEPIPGIEYEYNLVKENLKDFKLDDINALAKTLIKEDNRVLVVAGAEKEGLKIPSDEEILAVTKTVKNTELKPYTDIIAGAELMEQLPEPGSIVDEKKVESIDAVELKLSNGATVVLKHTDFKNDEVLLTAFSTGGTSVYPDEDHFSAINADGIIQESGVASYSNSDLRKILAGKSVYTAPTIGSETQNISANCRLGDMESMMQLIYLYFTAPRADQEAFQSYITKKKDQFKNLRQEPTNYFFDKYNRFKAQNHPRGNYLPTDEDWEKVDFNRAIEIYKDRYADASEFTFVIVGAFDLEKTKQFVQRYLASLPSNHRSETYKDLGIRPPKGLVEKDVYKGNDPKSMVILLFNQEVKSDKKSRFLFKQFGDILMRRYTEILREEMSGVYSVSARASINRIPYENASLQIIIPCSPDNVDSLVNAAIKEIKDIQENGPTEKDLVKAREIYKRDKEKNLENNRYWLAAIKNGYFYSDDLEDITSYKSMDYLTKDEVKKVANECININSYLKATLYPEEYTRKDEN